MADERFISIVIISIIFLLPVFSQTNGQQLITYVKLQVKNLKTNQSAVICANKQPFDFQSLVNTGPQPQFTLNYAVQESEFCRDDAHLDLSGQLLVVNSVLPYFVTDKERRCIRNAQRQNAAALLFLTNKLYFTFYSPELKNDSSVNITLLYMTRHNFEKLESLFNHEKAQSTDVVVTLEKYHEPAIKGTMILLFIIAMICVILGGLWSGWISKQLWLTSFDRGESKEEAVGQEAPAPVKSGEQLQSVPINYASICCWLGTVVTVLLLSYYFFDILVWFFIVAFTLLCMRSTNACLTLFWTQIFQEKLQKYRLDFGPCFRGMLRCFDWTNADPAKYIYTYREIIIGMASIAIAFVWCIFRKEPWANYLHLLLAVTFCIYAISGLRLSSLKWITMLLLVMFIYDIFMVFITPFFTSNRCSVMVEAATGRQCNEETSAAPPDNSKEQIPVVFRVPDFTDPLIGCFNLTVDYQYPSALLGFGDVLVPGLLIGFNCAFDLCWNVKYKAYFLTGIIGYGVGMILTFIALSFMQMAQPALVYLVPCTLVPTHVMAIVKKQWWEMWKGKLPKHLLNSSPEITEIAGGNHPTATVATPEDTEPLT